MKFTAHQKLYLKSPILRQIPGFPDIDTDYQNTMTSNQFTTVRNKHTAAGNRIKSNWSALKASKMEGGGDDTFFNSVLNSTKAGEDDYSYPAVVSANSSIIGLHNMRRSANFQQNTTLDNSTLK